MPNAESFDNRAVTAEEQDTVISKNIFDEVYSSPNGFKRNARDENLSPIQLNDLGLEFQKKMNGTDLLVSNTVPEQNLSDFGEESDNRQTRPPTKQEEWQMFILQQAQQKARVKLDVQKASKALGEHKFEEVGKIVSAVERAGNGDLQVFRGMLNSEANVEVESVGADGSFTLSFGISNADDTEYLVKAVRFDGNCKVIGAEVRDALFEGGYSISEIDPKKTMKELKEHIDVVQSRAKEKSGSGK